MKSTARFCFLSSWAKSFGVTLCSTKNLAIVRSR